MNAGTYHHRLVLLRCSRTQDTSTGDRPRTYAEAGNLWGVVQLDSASEAVTFGAERGTIQGTVRLRNWPSVSELDRLYWPFWGMTMTVDGIRPDRERNETVVDVTVFSRGDFYHDAAGGLGAT